jgi:polysaccharide export outer membrane protein
MIGIASHPAFAADMPETKYVIGPGDILDISVWKNDALSKLVTVLPDGYISFPLVGEVKAAGKTAEQFKTDLEKKLVEFIPQPTLSVIVQRVNMQIYIVGKVGSPGMYGLNENTNVLQALTMAKGLNPFAKRNDIMILRKIDGKTKTYEFMYDDVTAGNNLEQNIDMVRGDVIVVP